MGLQIRDERQRTALTGLSQAQFDSLLPVFSAIYRATSNKRMKKGSNLARAGVALAVAPKGNCQP